MWCVSGVRVDYVHVAFFVLASEFCDKGKISDPIKKFPDLEDVLCELMYSAYYRRSMIRSRRFMGRVYCVCRGDGLCEYIYQSWVSVVDVSGR